MKEKEDFFKNLVYNHKSIVARRIENLLQSNWDEDHTNWRIESKLDDKMRRRLREISKYGIGSD